MSTRRTSSSLLIDEPSPQVIPSLAVALGVNAAILLQQIHFWCKHAERGKDERKLKGGKWWTYNTYAEWQEQLPWLSESGIRKLVKELKDRNLIAVVKHGPKGKDHTLWYTVNYEAVESLNEDEDEEACATQGHMGCYSGTHHVSLSSTSRARALCADASTENLSENQSEISPEGAETSSATTPDEFVSFLAEELVGADVPYTKGWRGRHGKQFKEHLSRGVPGSTLYKACDRIIERWTGESHAKLSVENAVGDVLNGHPPKRAQPSSPTNATPPKVVEYIFANTKTEIIRNRESSIRQALAKHDFTMSGEPPYPVRKLLGGTDNEQWQVQDALESLCKRAGRQAASRDEPEVA